MKDTRKQSMLRERGEGIGQPLLMSLFFVIIGNLEFKKFRDKLHENSRRCG